MVDRTTGPCLELTVTCDAAEVADVTALFVDYGFNQGVVVEEATPREDDATTFAVTPSKLMTVRTTLSTDDMAPEQVREFRDTLWIVRQALWVMGRSRAIGALEIVERQEADWTNAWKANDYSVHRVGHRVLVKAPWHPYEPAADEVIVELDPGRAFGIGYHPTTQIGMEALEEAITPGARVLDVGTGSGTLAIAAALLGARQVDALDIDPAAVRSARDNADRNGVGGIVRVSLGSLDPDGPVESEYDLVMANISAPVLIELAPALVRAVAPGGKLLSVGMIEDSEASGHEAFTAQHLTLVSRTQRKEWVALVWHKQDGTSPID